MKLAVIIPAINEAANIAATIQSAAAAGADEIYLVDGGSSDTTVDIATSQFAGLIADGLSCLVLESSPGRAVQQHLGAQASNADVLLFLHADCQLPPGLKPQIRRELADRPKLFGCLRQRIAAERSVFRLLEWGNAMRTRCFGLAYGDQAIFISRELYEQIGGFSEVPLMEDVMLSQTARKFCWPKVIAGPLEVSARRWEKHGVLRQTLRNWWLLWRYFFGASPETLAQSYRRHDK